MYECLFCSNADKHANFNLLLLGVFLNVNLDLPYSNTVAFTLSCRCYFDILLLNDSSQSVSKDPQMSSHTVKKTSLYYDVINGDHMYATDSKLAVRNESLTTIGVRSNPCSRLCVHSVINANILDCKV